MRAHQIMSRHPITIGADAAVSEALHTMLKHHVSGLPVVDATGKLVGILSQGDFIRRAEIGTERRRGRWLTSLAGADRVAIDFARQHGRKVGEIMTPMPVTIAEDTPLEQIVKLMEARNIRRLPVMRGDELVGIVTQADFVSALANLAHDVPYRSEDDDQIRNSIIAAIGHAPWRPCGLNVGVRDGVVTLRGIVRNDNARRASVVAAENVPGVKQVDDELCARAAYPPSEADYGGGDFVSLPEQPSTADDAPL